MKVKIKKLTANAVIPKYSKDGDAGLDLVAVSKNYDEHGNFVYGTGLAFEIPKGFVGLLFPRSSNAATGLMLTNHVGIIDSGYRGEVMLKYAPTEKTNELWEPLKKYRVGDRIGQLIIIPYPHIEFEEAEELAESERGAGGYGSTGR